MVAVDMLTHASTKLTAQLSLSTVVADKAHVKLGESCAKPDNV